MPLNNTAKYPSKVPVKCFELRAIHTMRFQWLVLSFHLYLRVVLVYLRCLDIVGILQQDRQYVILICKNTHSLIYDRFIFTSASCPRVSPNVTVHVELLYTYTCNIRFSNMYLSKEMYYVHSHYVYHTGLLC